jgi:hypothetical protein
MKLFHAIAVFCSRSATMLADFVGDAKTKFATLLQTAMWAAVAAGASFAGFLFFVIALFIWTANEYDTVTACLTLGVLFAAIGIIAATVVVVIRRREAVRHRESRAAARPLWLDPIIVATGLDIMRLLGRRRATLFMIGALATTWLLSAQSRANQSTPDA